MKTKNNRLIKRKTQKIKKGGALPPLVTRKNIEEKLQKLLEYIHKLNDGTDTYVATAEKMCETVIGSFKALNLMSKPSTILNNVDNSDIKNLERAIKKLTELITQLKTNSSQEDTSLSKKMLAFVTKHKIEDKLKTMMKYFRNI